MDSTFIHDDEEELQAASTNALAEADKRVKAAVVDIPFKYRTFLDGSNAQTNYLRDKWPDIQTVTAKYTSRKILNQWLRICLISTLCIWINDYPDHLRCMPDPGHERAGRPPRHQANMGHHKF
uniref:Uncharacterized protein n=1 Tax=Tanacetum cinerariifolium TaxID=118510 RepID=A0A6L2NTE5_TANCI|nr:hypothetical protein [Tanacetum cinerariifolium]